MRFIERISLLCFASLCVVEGGACNLIEIRSESYERLIYKLDSGRWELCSAEILERVQDLDYARLDDSGAENKTQGP